MSSSIKTMKKTKLMIGDWIRIKPFEIPCRIKGLGEKHLKVEGFYSDQDYESVEPIPITPEILEKNRFIKYNSDGYPEHYRYELPSVNMVFKLFALYDCDFSFNINGTAMNINYVHELQHVLRLCGINKEIKL